MILTRGPTPAEQVIARCLELLAAAADDRVLEAVITRCLGELLAETGRFDEALEQADKAARVLDDANMAISSRASQHLDADARLLAGDRAGAEQSMLARWVFFQEIGAGLSADPHGIDSGTWLGGFYADEGRWDEAEACMAVCRAAVSTLNPSRVDDNRAIEGFLRVEARLAAHRGAVAEALELAEAALANTARADEPNARARTWLALAEVHRTAGNQAEADDATARALALYEKKGNVAAATQLRAAVVA